MFRILYLGLLGFVILMGSMVYDSFYEEPTIIIKIGFGLFFGAAVLLCIRGIITNGDL